MSESASEGAGLPSRLHGQGRDLEDGGQLEAALVKYQRALGLFERAGISERQVAAVLNGIGNVFRKQGADARALEHYKRALSIEVGTLGERHAEVAGTLHNMGLVFHTMGEYVRALKKFERALSIKTEVFGERHSSVADTLHSMAIVFNRQGEYVRALENYERAMSIKVEALGERHPDVALSLNNMALVFGNQGEDARALEMFERALSIKIETLGERHASVAETLNGIAGVLSRQGEHVHALENLERALAIKIEALGQRHPYVAETLNSLANTHSNLERVEDASRYAFLALDMRLEFFGESHVYTGFSRRTLAAILEKTENYHGALAQARAAAAIFFRQLGPDHSDTRKCKALVRRLEELVAGDRNSPADAAANIVVPSEALADLPRRRPSGVVQGRALSSNDGREVHRVLFNGGEYALKTVPAGEFRMFEREVEAMRACDHPNVARVLDFGRDGPRMWFRQELFTADLARVIDARAARARDKTSFDGYFRAQEIHEIALCVVRAMHYMHDVQSLAHCDMKTAQVLVDLDGPFVTRVALTDFGIAQPGRRRLIDTSAERFHDASSGDVRGKISDGTNGDSNDSPDVPTEGDDLQHALGYSPGWTAPEVVANFQDQVAGHPGRAFDAFAADMFALCLVLHHIITGESFDPSAGVGTSKARRCRWNLSDLQRTDRGPYVSYPCPNDAPAAEKVVSLLSGITTVHAHGLKQNPGDRLSAAEALSIMTAAPVPEDSDELYDEIFCCADSPGSGADDVAEGSVSLADAVAASPDVPTWLEQVGLFGLDEEFPVLSKYSLPTLQLRTQEELEAILVRSGRTQTVGDDTVASNDATEVSPSSSTLVFTAEDLFAALHLSE
jgi:tetratricopeptide (TPR) repeat protein